MPFDPLKSGANGRLRVNGVEGLRAVGDARMYECIETEYNQPDCLDKADPNHYLRL